jgi:hypothetical protein
MLIRIIERLPRESLYQSRLAMDPDIAAEAMEHYDPANEPESERDFVGYSMTVEMLTHIANLLQQNIAVQIGVATRNYTKPQLIPTPKSAFDRAVDEWEKDFIDSRAAMFGLN